MAEITLNQVTTNQKLIDWVYVWSAILQPAQIHW
jgi:hypothetical protein